MGSSLTDLDLLAEGILSLNLVQAADLVGRLEKSMGISSGSLMLGVGPSAQGGDSSSAVVESKTEFDVTLIEIDSAKRIAVIRIVKNLNPDLGLMEIGNLVDSLPQVLVTKVSKDKAEEIKEKLLAAGALKVDVK